ncbi:MAG: hypothetical protein ACJ8M1_05880 [Chthoniobacterales bacterium]
MKLLSCRITAAVLCLGLSVSVAVAGPFRTKIITSSDDPLVLSLAENVFLQIRNFTQEGGSLRGTVTVNIDGQTANVLSASQISSSSLLFAPEVINRVNVAGPATVTVKPVANATLAITYRKVREGAPLATPAPTPTPTPTATPTP